MNEKFTPGPWRVHLDKRKGTACAIIEDRTGDCVARTVYRFHRGERNANGNLISVAPDMYNIVAKLEEMAFSGCASVEDVQNLIQRAMFVAKKARGEK